MDIGVLGTGIVGQAIAARCAELGPTPAARASAPPIAPGP